MRASIVPEEYFKGNFVVNPTTLKQKLKQVKAFVFDWDGVFNDGRKNLEGHSNFSETDAMAVNLMRFSHFLLYKQLPITILITGENNRLAFSYAEREHFNHVYFKVSHKEQALMHLCEQHKISPADILFVFDDVLDFSLAKLAGVRFMVGRSANPLLNEFAENNRLADYITKHSGVNHAVREVSEIVMTMCNNYSVAVEHRMRYTDAYKDYLGLRNQLSTGYFTIQNEQVVPAQP